MLIKFIRVIRIPFRVLLKIPFRIFSNELIIRLMNPYPYHKYTLGSKYISYTFRDKSPIINDHGDEDYSSYGILIQGPSTNHKRFLLGSIYYYLNQFPGIIVILSTWDSSLINKFDDYSNFYYIDNSIIEKNKNNWDLKTNMNFQITSTLNGLNKLKELGVKKVIKTRTDKRYYSNTLIRDLENISFLHDREGVKRLILLDQNAVLGIPFHLDDTFQFGEIDQLLRLWNIDTIKKNDEILNQTSKGRLRFGVQPYPFVNYIFKGRISDYSNFTINESMKLIVENFIIIQRETIGSFWIKYQLKENFSKKTAYDDEFSNRLSYSDWLKYEVERMTTNETLQR
jgi:hypothetical protein